MVQIETDVFIVGAGPAGASLACFLTNYGVTGLIISKASSTVRTPRSHYTNNATFECLRDIGLEEECRQLATPRELLMYSRICTTMGGEELSRTYNCGTDPNRYGEFKQASPCEQADLPQSVLEPILLRVATQNGFHLRWDCQFVSFHQDETTSKVHSVIQDVLTNQKITVISKFLCGADGARSVVARELQLPFNDTPGGGLALNVFVDADLNHLLTPHSPGLIHILLHPTRPQPDFCSLAIARFVKPFTQWVFVMLARPNITAITATPSEILSHVHDLIGDPSVKVTLKRLSTWKINETYAERYTTPGKNNIFCLGDAVHRHPPFNGLGSNTSIQDAYNLAWKIGFVHQSLASLSLLDSYTAERQPIGKAIVKRANDTGRMHAKLFSLLGVPNPDTADKLQILSRLGDDKAQGEEQRLAFQILVEGLDVERHGFGMEMNQLYQSDALYPDDETGPPPTNTGPPEHADLYYRESTYPGSRLPHAWLRAPAAGSKEPMISTHDLAGKGKYTLFTGIGGKKGWVEAAGMVKGLLGVEVVVHSIGWREDYRDVFFDWGRKRGVGERGAVLVRRDRVVAWRCDNVGGGDGWGERLTRVMARILGR
ncbi:hypothetical protein QC764_511100 [Podospora pseudoanserina]|uniref:FAD-binding domain-containing protein n=1 Tax=Podospora pseudoanserina TaxID=2609844 RepID=A0ABR0I7X0_9PEZI|nr:hypothetical protein QC764_511100 [Podospora pseudoanserina]